MLHILHGVVLDVPRAVRHWPVYGVDPSHVSPPVSPVWSVSLAFGVQRDDLGPQPPVGKVMWDWEDTDDVTRLWVRGGLAPALLHVVVDRAAATIDIDHTLPDDADTDTVADVLDLVNRWIIADLARVQSNALPLHAAVVTPDTADVGDIGGIAVLGPSGRGKSSLAAALVALGGEVFCDEPACVVVRDDRAVVLAGVRAVRIGPECLDVFDEVGRPRPAHVIDTYGKAVMPAHTAAGPADVDLAAIVVLDERRAEGEPLEVRRLEPGEALGRLMHERYARAHADGRVPSDFSRVAAVVARVPVYAVSFLDDRTRLVASAATLVQEIASAHG